MIAFLVKIWSLRVAVLATLRKSVELDAALRNDAAHHRDLVFHAAPQVRASYALPSWETTGNVLEFESSTGDVTVSALQLQRGATG